MFPRSQENRFVTILYAQSQQPSKRAADGKITSDAGMLSTVKRCIRCRQKVSAAESIKD